MRTPRDFVVCLPPRELKSLGCPEQAIRPVREINLEFFQLWYILMYEYIVLMSTFLVLLLLLLYFIKFFAYFILYILAPNVIGFEWTSSLIGPQSLDMKQICSTSEKAVVDLWIPPGQMIAENRNQSHQPL